MVTSKKKGKPETGLSLPGDGSLYDALTKPLIKAAPSRGMWFLAGLAYLLIGSGMALILFATFKPHGGLDYTLSLFLLAFAMYAFLRGVTSVARGFFKGASEPTLHYGKRFDEEYELIPQPGTSEDAPYAERYFKRDGNTLYVRIKGDNGGVYDLPISCFFAKKPLHKADSIRTVYDGLDGFPPHIRIISSKWFADRRFLHYELHAPKSEKPGIKKLIHEVNSAAYSELYAKATNTFGESAVAKLIDEPVRYPGVGNLVEAIDNILEDDDDNEAVEATVEEAYGFAARSVGLFFLHLVTFVLLAIVNWQTHFGGGAQAVPPPLISVTLFLVALSAVSSVASARNLAKAENKFVEVWEYDDLQFDMLPFTSPNHADAKAEDYFTEHDGEKYVLLREVEYGIIGTYKIPANARVHYSLDDDETPGCNIVGKEGVLKEFVILFPKKLSPSANSTSEE